MNSTWTKPTILLADKEGDSESLIHSLELHNYNILVSRNLKETVDLLKAENPVVLLFWDNREEKDNLLFIMRVHDGMKIPIIFLSIQSRISYILGAYKAGVDDYICLPQPAWLITLKIRIALRCCEKPSPGPTSSIVIKTEHSTLIMYPLSRQLYYGEIEIELTHQEWDLFYYFVERQNQIIPRTRLMASHYSGLEPESRNLDNHIKNIRSKLPDPQCIQTVRGIGYYFYGEIFKDEQKAADLLCG